MSSPDPEPTPGDVMRRLGRLENKVDRLLLAAGLTPPRDADARVQPPGSCRRCHGSGWAEGDSLITGCSQCAGSGTVR